MPQTTSVPRWRNDISEKARDTSGAGTLRGKGSIQHRPCEETGPKGLQGRLGGLTRKAKEGKATAERHSHGASQFKFESGEVLTIARDTDGKRHYTVLPADQADTFFVGLLEGTPAAEAARAAEAEAAANTASVA